MKNLLISLAIVAACFVSIRPARADYDIETRANVVKVAIHFKGYVKDFTFATPTTTVIKPCPRNPNVKESVCLYEVGRHGTERRIYSYYVPANDWVYPTYVTRDDVASK